MADKNKKNNKAKKINKTDLIDILASNLGITKVKAEEYLNTTVNTIVDLVIEGQDVHISGFGAFYRTYRKSRTGVNPNTKDKMSIPANKGVAFRVGKNFRDKVRAS